MHFLVIPQKNFWSSRDITGNHLPVEHLSHHSPGNLLLAFPFPRFIHIRCLLPDWVDMLIYFLKDFYHINTQGCHWAVLLTCTLGIYAQRLICRCEQWWTQKETLGWSPSPLAWLTGSSWKEQWTTQGTSSEHTSTS